MAPMTDRCSTHPDAAATHRCDGCSELLCDACIEDGHSLLFCKLCGELAVPLAEGPAERRREPGRPRRTRAAYTLRDALSYPLRGAGAWLFGVYVGLVALLSGLSFVPGLGLPMVILFAGMMLMMAGLLVSIIRGTANGDNEMPDWPDWDPYQRLRDFLLLLSAYLVALMPIVALLYLAGCGVLDLARGEWSVICWLAFAAGLVIGAVLWVVALGAVVLYDAPLGAFRVDLHLAAVGVFKGSLVQVMVFLVLLTLASEFLKWMVFSELPLVGALLESAIGTYTMFTGSHLIGLLFRQHSDAIDRLYMG